MQTYLERKREEAFMKKFTILFFKLTKNKYNINGFISIKGRDDAFGHLVYSFDTFNFKNDYLKIYNDLQDKVTLEEVKAKSDFCIFFRHVGNAKKLDIKLKIHSTNFVEMIFFTPGPKMTWEENDNMGFLNYRVIYDVTDIKTEDGFDRIRTVKPEYAYLIK